MPLDWMTLSQIVVSLPGDPGDGQLIAANPLTPRSVHFSRERGEVKCSAPPAAAADPFPRLSLHATDVCSSFVSCAKARGWRRGFHNEGRSEKSQAPELGTHWPSFQEELTREGACSKFCSLPSILSWHVYYHVSVQRRLFMRSRSSDSNAKFQTKNFTH